MVVIAAGFALLSADETAGFHELAGELVSWRWFELEALPGGFLWVVVVAPVAAVGALAMLWWLRRQVPAGHRARPLALAAVLVWLLVPLVETYAGATRVMGGFVVVLEEMLEGIGQALMLGAAVELVGTAPRRLWHDPVGKEVA